MEFTLGLKDLMYIVTNVVGVVSIILMLRNRVKNLEDKMNLYKSTLFKSDASLNIVNVASCEAHRKEGEKICQEKRAEIAEKQNKTAEIVESVVKKIDTVNINVIKIAAHMKVNLEE